MMLIMTVYGVVFLALTGKLMADENGTLHSCSPYNFLNATVFRANRNLVLESLRKKISTNRFGTDLQGNGLDPVYGLAQCRADLPLSHCSQCFEKAEEELELLCPTQNGGRVFVDGCFLRYENASIFTQLFDSGISNCSSSSNSSAVKFSDITGKLLGETVGKALTNNSFAIAWTVESDSSTNIYALAQCWTSLTTQGCQTCLQEAQNLIQNCLPSTEGEVLEAGCYLRYATYPFFSPNGITATILSGGSKSKTVGIILGIIGGAVLVMAAAFFAWSKLRKRSFPNKWRKRAWSGGELELGENSAWFDYEDLREATGNFDSENKIGEGGFGEVYKGTLRDGREIAVKRLFDSESSAATAEFSTEMELISSVCHRNLVTVLGCCTLQNQRFLVFEYMANRSLNRHLFGKEGICLSWEERFNIIFGTARGLAYLHEHSHVRIVHRDIKAANILLDDKFQPKIADFGLARLFPHDRTHLTTRVGGTLGYTAPEYAVHGQLTEKADVYSFGVVVLEIVSGRKCIQTNLPADMQLLPRWAWRLYQRNEGLGIVDPRLEGLFDAEQVLRVINISLLCVHDSPTKRPSMSNIVSMLASHSPMLRDAAQEKPAFMKKVGNTQYLFTSSTSQSTFSSTAGASNSSASMSQSTFSSTAGPSNSSASISNTLLPR